LLLLLRANGARSRSPLFAQLPLHTFLPANCVSHQSPGETVNTKGSYAGLTRLFKLKSSAFVLLEHDASVVETNSNKYSLVSEGSGCVWPWDALKGCSFFGLLRREVWALSLSRPCKHSSELVLPPYVNPQAAASPGSLPASSGDPRMGCLTALPGDRQLLARHRTPSDVSSEKHRAWLGCFTAPLAAGVLS